MTPYSGGKELRESSRNSGPVYPRLFLPEPVTGSNITRNLISNGTISPEENPFRTSDRSLMSFRRECILSLISIIGVEWENPEKVV